MIAGRRSADQEFFAIAMIFGQQIFVSSGHIYYEEGSYTGNVFGTYRCGSAVHKVAVPFTAQIFQGTVATFRDADPYGTIADYSATIDWGDRGVSAGTIVAGPKGSFEVTGTHSYSAVGIYEIALVITDVGGSNALAIPLASVASMTPRARFSAPAGVAKAGRRCSTPLARSLPARLSPECAGR